MNGDTYEIWVCEDCRLAEHGYDDHLSEDGTITANGLVPMGLVPDTHHIFDATCSNHFYGQTVTPDSTDDDGDPVEATCDQCGGHDWEDGMDYFGMGTCDGCGTHLAGARYRFTVLDATITSEGN